MQDATLMQAQPGAPSAKAQSWGVVISIVIIVLMILIGAFYSWGKRITEQNSLITQTASDITN
ncbi:MAG TPA: hypothetical protein VFP46_00570 [Candidatus Paceibacterota bacterium]|nr:hypothetical protein [Candidatus Paceibacterota bacterium]